MNKTIGIVIAVIVVLGAIFYFVRTPETTTTPEAIPSTSSTTTTTTTTTQETTQGRVVFSVTDAAADMSTISEINMKVNKVEMHSAAKGWMTVSTTPRTYSLLALNASNKSELLADVKAEVGTYDQVRLMVDSISVKTKAGATKVAKLPSGELKLNTTVVVKEDETASVNLDFLADKSLHTTGNGSYIFAPVVKTESKSSATVNVDATNNVTVSGGKVDDSSSSGMDVDGSVKLNFELKKDLKLNLGTDNNIKLEL